MGEPRVAVVGLGNVLMGDDGLGPTAVRTLAAEYDLAPGVSAEDLGTPGLDLTPFVADLHALIILDTVSATGAPGEVRCYRRDEILAHAPQPRLSPHDPGLKEALLTLEFGGRAPQEVLLVGVIPEVVDRGTELSGAVAKAVGDALRCVLDELERLGVPARRKELPQRPDLWWRG